MLLKNSRRLFQLKPVLAVAFLFAASSLLFGTWVSYIPAIKEKLSFTDATLGLSLLFSPLGAITGVFISTKIFSKIPVGKWMLGGYLALCIIMVLQIESPNRPTLWICLYCFGVVSFLNGVATNATINMMEKKYDRLLMSSCHALYSLGGAVSAGIAATLVALGFAKGWHIVIVVTAIVAIIYFNRNHILQNQEIIHSGSGLKFPSVSVLGISFICMILFMAEGCVADWSGIYFKEVLQAPKEYVSLGYGSFAVAMTIGRLNGDYIVSKTGNKKAVVWGCILAAMGFLMVVSIDVIAVVLGGYIVIGFGCSSIVPILFRASANIPGLSRVEGFAMVTTGGLIGFLAGPSLIGIVSEQVGLSAGLSLLVLLAMAAAVVAWRNPFLTIPNAKPITQNFNEQLY